jgi:hypothetical protein
MPDIKNIKKNISFKSFLLGVGEFFRDKIEMVVFSLFLLLSICCVYIWYYYVYDYQWSVEKKAEYLRTKDSEVTFDREKFQEIVEKEAKRAEEYARPIEIKKDIFGIK